MKRLHVQQISEEAMLLSPAEAKEKLHDNAIAPSTLKQYVTRINCIRNFLRQINAQELTKGIFFQYIAALDSLSLPAKCYASQARSAVLHFQQSRDIWCSPSGHYWAKDSDVIRACKGFAYKAKGGSRPRGQVTPTMFKEFLSFLYRFYPKFVHPSIVLFGTGLRIGALTSIRAQDFCPMTNTLSFPDKAANATNARPAWAEKKIVDPEVIEILTWYQKVTQPSQLLFGIDRCPITDFRSVIKEGAKHLQWDPELNFDGPHTLRHGATVHLAKFAKNEDELLTLVGISQKMLSTYKRPNDQRKRDRQE